MLTFRLELIFWNWFNEIGDCTPLVLTVGEYLTGLLLFVEMGERVGSGV